MSVAAFRGVAQWSLQQIRSTQPNIPIRSMATLNGPKLVEEMSGGELKPNVYTGTVLLAPRANLQGIRDNVVQVAHHAAVYSPLGDACREQHPRVGL